MYHFYQFNKLLQASLHINQQESHDQVLGMTELKGID